MKNIFRFTLLALALVLIGCGDLDQPDNEEVIGGEIVADTPGSFIKASLIEANTTGVDENTIVYGYKAYKIPYTTKDETGNEVSASGLMTVPTGSDIPEQALANGFSLISDSHGTIFANRDAPTEEVKANASPAGSSIILTSLNAFVTLQADYVGFGDSSEHYHPFILKDSLANATVDFIKAARIFAENNNISLSGQLFITGYSEGGYAAMATLKKVEEEDTGLIVTMAAPMAGPYAVEALAIDVLSADTLSVPSFMANIAYAYGLTYDEDVANMVNEPYALKLETLFNGDFNRTQIDLELTETTTGDDGLFVQEFVDNVIDVNNTEYWFRQRAKDNSVHAWAPTTALRLVHCLGDDVIDVVVSQNTLIEMIGLGASNVGFVPVEIAVTGDPLTALRYDHSDCGPVAYSVTASIFSTVRGY